MDRTISTGKQNEWKTLQKKKEYNSNCIGTNLLKQQEKIINDCVKGYKSFLPESLIYYEG